MGTGEWGNGEGGTGTGTGDKDGWTEGRGCGDGTEDENGGTGTGGRERRDLETGGLRRGNRIGGRWNEDGDRNISLTS